jgi:hypothetical protein
MAWLCAWFRSWGTPPLPAFETLNLDGADAQTVEYVRKIYTSASFQRDPKRYLAEWRERRGNTEEWRMPEDAALILVGRLVDKL